MTNVVTRSSTVRRFDGHPWVRGGVDCHDVLTGRKSVISRSSKACRATGDCHGGDHDPPGLVTTIPAIVLPIGVSPQPERHRIGPG